MKKPAHIKRRGKASLKRPQFQEMVALQGLWTIHSMVAPNSAVLLWLGVPVALIVAEVARRAHAQRFPTLLSQAALYVQLVLAEIGLDQAHWAAGGSGMVAHKVVIMTILVAIMAFLEVAARRDRGARPYSDRRPPLRRRSAFHLPKASNAPRRNCMPRRGRVSTTPRRRRRLANPGPPRRSNHNTRPRPRITPTTGLTRRIPPKRNKPNTH